MRVITKTILLTTLLISWLPVIAKQSDTQAIEPNMPILDESQSDITTKWSNAKDSTKKALQQTQEAGSAIWEASKESSQEIWSDSKEISEQVWDNVKDKSAIAIEKSETLLKRGNEKIDKLLENKQETTLPEDTDNIL
jgi:hypothetical protein